MVATLLYNSASPTSASQRYPQRQQALSSLSAAFMRKECSLIVSHAARAIAAGSLHARTHENC